MKSFDEFYEFLLSEDCFEKCLVSFIDEHQRQRYIEQTDIWAYRGKITDLWMSGDDTIKIEGYEQFKYIEKFFETMPKLSHKIKVTNPKTQVESEVVLEGLASFFA